MNRSLSLLNLRFLHFKHVLLSHQNFSTALEEKIIIPKRIHRGPTDILQALASTVKVDPTAPHYKYHDDPYLIPTSNTGKRTFAMAKESGRKAAHWVRQQHADLFQHQVADPPIKAFIPPKVYDENSEVTEEILKAVISDVQVSSAITVYKNLEKKQVKLSNETLQELLELLCFYNSEDTLSEEFIEERWFKATTKGKNWLKKTWKDGDMAETIFISIKNPGAAAYCALIQGMAKYYQVERAWELFQEAREKQLPVTTETYNSLIKVASFMKEGFDLRWQFVEDMLKSLAAEKLKPNLGTLNAILETLSTMSGYKNTKHYLLQTLSEFKKIGVEPSLASWYFVLITFCRERGQRSHVLADIINYIEGKQFEILDMKDTYFFVTAMDVCQKHIFDKDLAHRVNDLLHTGNNYDLIGDSYKESIYYRHYFTLLCATEPLEVFMEYYKQLVPNIYIPEPSVVEELLKAVEINSAIDYIPKLWSDMVLFDHTDRENLLILLLNIMTNNQPTENLELSKQFSKIAWDIWTKIEEQPKERITKLNFTGEMLGNIMILTLRDNNFNKACAIMDKLDKEPQNVMGVPGIAALKLFVEHCVEKKIPSKAITCIQYCAENGFDEAANLAKYLDKNLTLDETHLTKLMSIVGKDVLSKETVSSN